MVHGSGHYEKFNLTNPGQSRGNWGCYPNAYARATRSRNFNMLPDPGSTRLANLFSNHLYYWGDAHYERPIGR